MLLAILVIAYHLAVPMSTSRVIYIPQGSIFKIIAQLEKNGFDVSPVDAYLLRMIGSPQQGWIDIGETVLSKGDFLYKITVSKAALEEVMIIPGETLYVIIKELSEKLSLKENALYESYMKYAPYSDGVILPETYKVPIGISANHLMYYLVNHSLKTHKKLAAKILGRYDARQWFKYVTIASVIQKEAANSKEMPLVSAVIYNRLKKGMPLQMDGTLNYGRYSNLAVTAERIRKDNSSFNTYKNKGLPSYPICSVSIDAVKAAIAPADVDYLYFVRGKDGEHIFSKSYRDHVNNIHNGNK